MDLSAITDLIKVRDYIANSLNNNSIDRKTLSELGKMLLLTDQKILNMLNTDKFKDYIDYANANKAIAENRRITSGVFDEANRIKAGK